jgi:hypothetical protein
LVFTNYYYPQFQSHECPMLVLATRRCRKMWMNHLNFLPIVIAILYIVITQNKMSFCLKKVQRPFFPTDICSEICGVFMAQSAVGLLLRAIILRPFRQGSRRPGRTETVQCDLTQTVCPLPGQHQQTEARWFRMLNGSRFIRDIMAFKWMGCRPALC